MTFVLRHKFEHPNLASPSAFGMDAKPCPFCKSSAVAVTVTHRPHVSCVDCGTDGPQADPGADPRMAISLWNNRA